MNFLDAIILVPLIWGAYNGFRKGLIIEIASLLALILGIYGSMKFSFIAAQWLNSQFDWSPKAVQIASFVITFIVIVVVVHMIARAIEKLVKAVSLGLVNRIFGVLFGTLKYLIFLAVIFYFVNKADSRYPFIGEENKKGSLLYNSVVGIFPWLYPQIMEEIQEEDQSIIA